MVFNGERATIGERMRKEELRLMVWFALPLKYKENDSC